jgi:hypothetical protein
LADVVLDSEAALDGVDGSRVAAFLGGAVFGPDAALSLDDDDDAAVSVAVSFAVSAFAPFSLGAAVGSDQDPLTAEGIVGGARGFWSPLLP